MVPNVVEFDVYREAV